MEETDGDRIKVLENFDYKIISQIFVKCVCAFVIGR